MRRIVLFILFSLVGFNASALDGFSLDIGTDTGTESTTLLGASVKWNWESKWFTEGDWYVGGYWEAGIGHWNGKSGKYNNSSITHIGVTPVFRLTRHQPLANGTMPFFEGAIGFHIMSDDKIGDKNLGGKFTFGDHVAAGLQFGDRREYEISARLQHFSNGAIYSRNPGINFAEVRFGYNFE